MVDILKAVIGYDLVLGGILFLTTVVKWYALRPRIEKNGWENMNPCDAMTFLVYAIPVFGPMSFLALMTTLDEGAVTSRAEAGDVITVIVGPMRYVFADGTDKNKGGSSR